MEKPRCEGRRHSGVIRIAMLVLAVTSTAFAQPSGVLTGTITDSATHLPLNHALIDIPSAPATRDVSGPDGSFRLSDLPAGDLKIHVTAAGYHALDQSVRLSDGEHASSLFEMHPMARITGRIVDRETGAALARDVECAKATLTPDNFLPEPVFTNPDGTFRIEGLEAGDYRLTANWEGSATLATDLSEKTKSTTVYGTYVFPERIHLVEGEQRFVEIRVGKTEAHSASVSIESPRGYESLTSRITYGTFTDGDFVQLRDIGTRPEGLFRIDGLTPGIYRIYAQAGKDSTAAFGSVPLTISDHDVEDLHIKLTPGVNVTGSIRMLEENETVPAKMSDLLVTLAPTDRPWFATLGAVMTVQDARFHADGVMQGSYEPELRGLPDGYAVSAVVFNGADALGQPVPLHGSGEIVFIVTSKTASITGFVRDANENPIANALVELQHEPAFATGHIAHFVTGVSGGFQFHNLPPGRYSIEGAQPIDLQPGQTVSVSVTR